MDLTERRAPLNRPFGLMGPPDEGGPMPISDSDRFHQDDGRGVECRALASIEAGLRADGPRLGRRMRAWPVTPGVGSLSHRWLIRLTAAWTLLVVVLLLVAVALHSPPLAGGGLVLLIVLPAVVVVAGRRMDLHRARCAETQYVH